MGSPLVWKLDSTLQFGGFDSRRVHQNIDILQLLLYYEYVESNYVDSRKGAKLKTRKLLETGAFLLYNRQYFNIIKSFKVLFIKCNNL